MQKKGKLSEHKIDIVSACLILLACLFLGMGVWLHRNSVVQDTRFNNEPIVSLTDEFRVTCGNESYMTQLPANFDGHAGEKITLTGSLAWEGEHNNALLFYVRQSDVSVYLNGELLTESDKNRKLPMEIPPSSRWYLFRLPETFYSGELRIEITPFFDEYAKELPEIYLGSKSAFLYMILGKAALSLGLGLPLLLLGNVMLLLGWFLKERELAKRIRRLAVLTIIMTVWMMSESQISQVFWWNLVDSVYVLFASYYLIPVVLMAFLLTFRTISDHRYMHWLFWGTAGVYLIIQFLQIAGVAYYVKMVSVVHAEIVVIVFGILSCYLSARKAGRDGEDFSIYYALLILSLFALADGLSYYWDPAQENGRYTLVGVAIFLVYLGYSALRQLSELQKRRAVEAVYRELAFMDVMTGLANRSAFERQQEIVRQSGKTDGIIFMMMDLNGLKTINDEYGHAAGDDAIITTAYAIKECFDRVCKCFRIGGDEFCVIAEDVPEAEFIEMHRVFEGNLEEISKGKSYPYSVASAYAVTENNDFTACMRQADQLMYQKKAEMKVKRNAR